MAVSNGLSLELMQSSPKGFNLTENVKLILKEAQDLNNTLDIKESTNSKLAIWAPLSFSELNLSMLNFKKAFAHEVAKNLNLLASSLPNNLEALLVSPYNNLASLDLSLAYLAKGKVSYYLFEPLYKATDSFNANSCQISTCYLKNFELGLILVQGENFNLDFYREELLAKINKYSNLKMLGILSTIPYVNGLINNIFAQINNLAKNLTCKYEFFFLNNCGLQDNLIYHGASFILDKSCKIIAKAESFKRSRLSLNLNYLSKIEEIKPQVEFTNGDQAAELFAALRFGLYEYLLKLDPKVVFIGLSGGLDSALVLVILAKAFPKEKIVPVYMPSVYNQESSFKDAKELCANLKIKLEVLPINEIFRVFKEQLEPLFKNFLDYQGDVSLENLQARIRGTLLYTLANHAQGLVLNTSNKSEIAMGYSTLYGDTVGALSVLGDISKTKVYELARWYNKVNYLEKIPENILTKAPSAELRPNQKDTDSLPEYSLLDSWLDNLWKGDPPKDPFSRKIWQTFSKNEFKRRQEPESLIVSEKSLGRKIKLKLMENFIPEI